VAAPIPELAPVTTAARWMGVFSVSEFLFWLILSAYRERHFEEAHVNVKE
jgi:hypothetical protein